jgi:hypothetical protein
MRKVLPYSSFNLFSAGIQSSVLSEVVLDMQNVAVVVIRFVRIVDKVNLYAFEIF